MAEVWIVSAKQKTGVAPKVVGKSFDIRTGGSTIVANSFAVDKLSDGAPHFSSYKSVKIGIPSALARSLDTSGLTRDDIRQIIPDRTLDRRIADGENLKIDEADGLARLLRVVAMARRVFGDNALADEWLRSANPALDGMIPIQMARTDLGGREVEAVLGRIEHGVFA